MNKAYTWIEWYSVDDEFNSPIDGDIISCLIEEDNVCYWIVDGVYCGETNEYLHAATRIKLHGVKYWSNGVVDKLYIER